MFPTLGEVQAKAGKLEKDLRDMEKDVRMLLLCVSVYIPVYLCVEAVGGARPSVHPFVPLSPRTIPNHINKLNQKQGERLRPPKVPNGFPKREHSVRAVDFGSRAKPPRTHTNTQHNHKTKQEYEYIGFVAKLGYVKDPRMARLLSLYLGAHASDWHAGFFFAYCLPVALSTTKTNIPSASQKPSNNTYPPHNPKYQPGEKRMSALVFERKELLSRFTDRFTSPSSFSLDTCSVYTYIDNHGWVCRSVPRPCGSALALWGTPHARIVSVKHVRGMYVSTTRSPPPTPHAERIMMTTTTAPSGSAPRRRRRRRDSCP